MELTVVESSMIYAVGYDPETETLHVVFNSGGTYIYENVPQDIYDGLMAAESKGRYMHAYVIDMYPYSRRR